MNRLSFLLLLSVHSLYAQDLDKLCEKKRNEILIMTAKKVVMKHGPDYYRNYKLPVIEKDSITTKNASERHRLNIGRIFYRVKFLYDRKKEELNLNEAAMVAIWEDTGKAFSVLFGNGFGLFDLDKEETDIQIPYQSIPKVEEFEQSLDRLSKKMRVEVLIAKAKETVLKYGPGYYRENTKPMINYKKMSKEDSANGSTDAGRKFYTVVFPYDKNKEQFNMEYTASVLIWADNSEAFRVFFGNGIGLLNIDKKEPMSQVSYEPLQPVEIIDWSIFENRNDTLDIK